VATCAEAVNLFSCVCVCYPSRVHRICHWGCSRVPFHTDFYLLLSLEEEGEKRWIPDQPRFFFSVTQLH
jgi:hypothetical protein